MKKSFAAKAPQKKQEPALSAAAIEAFEKGGAGHDQRGKLSGRVEEMQRFGAEVPKSVHARFKAAAQMNGTTIREEVLAFIEKRLPELEKAAGISYK